jgi:hypothetical protein
MWLAGQLSIVLDEQTLDDPTSAMARRSSAAVCDVNKKPGCTREMKAGTIISSFDLKRDIEKSSGTPVTWLLDEPRPLVSSSRAVGFLISGINLSDSTLTEVRGALKPDTTEGELELALNVQGKKIEGKGAIPPGARFSLGLEITKTNSQNQFGGAIFIFRYIYAGQQTALFWHLTPSMTARLGKR